MEGFLQGVGKGVIGVGIQPLSGVLDLLSKTTEGANAMRMKLAAAITFEQQLLRRRLPRVIGGDNVLRPYDEYKARGQVCTFAGHSISGGKLTLLSNRINLQLPLDTQLTVCDFHVLCDWFSRF